MAGITNDLNINQYLEQIIEKYNLDRHYPAYRISRQACVYIEKWIRNLSDMEETFLFIGMDERALQLIRGWSTGDSIKILLVSSVKELDDYIERLRDFNKIYIVSYTKTIEILHWIWRHDLQAESVYDILENEYIYPQMEFYRFIPPLIMSDELSLYGNFKENSVDGSSLTLYEYYYQKQRLPHSTSEEDKRRIREKLFFLALCMRNFIEAESVLKTMPDNTEYQKCWYEIKALLDKIKDTLAEKRQKHIIIYWLDALDYEAGTKLEYLQKQREHSLYFHNAFTVTFGTNPTCKTIFCGIRQVDDLGYRIRYFRDVPQIDEAEHIGTDNSPLLMDIEEQGYDFSILSNYLSKSFAKKYNHDMWSTRETPCSEVFWNLVDQIIQSKQPTVYLAHALTEIHAPCLSVRRNRFEKDYINESLTAQYEELNAQLRFYDEMLGSGSYRIYMSDHGRVRFDICRNVHVHFQIYHAEWEKREIDKLFCYLDFPKIMHQLLTDGNIDETMWGREYVPIQDVDFYNGEMLKRPLKGNGLDRLPFYTAHKGVVTDEYIYLRFKCGEELFHKWSDDPFNPVFWNNDNQLDEELLEELRIKTGEFPKELDSDSRFCFSVNTYTVYENIKRSVQKAADLLNKKLSCYADGSIVLMGEDYPTRWLYAILTKENRKKICGTDDKDSIKVVLLSYYEHQEELRFEAERIYNGFEIIDIYQFWKEQGYSFPRDFWYGLEEDREIPFLDLAE